MERYRVYYKSGGENTLPRSLISLLSMASILHQSDTSITLGVFAFLNDDYIAASVPNLRDVTASHTPKGSGTLSDKRATSIFDVNQWVGCSSPLPTPSSVPHSLFNHATAREALREQIQTFGAIRSANQINTKKPSYKVAIKLAVLHNTLSVAFASRGNQINETLSLDLNKSSDWIPTTESPMDSLEAEETTTTTLNEIYAKLTPKQTLVAELLSDGKSQIEVAAILNISPRVVSHHISRIRARLSR